MAAPTMAGEFEDVESFRLRAREWIAANLPPARSSSTDEGEDMMGSDFDDEAWIRARELQKLLYSGGFAGLCYPKQYGGQGLTPAHQKAFNDEVAGYEMPLLLNTPTFTICGPTILEMANENQKQEHLAAAIRGEEVFVQFLSEPSGGSDLAGAITRATRDGDVFVLNGSKIWSSGAYAADYALCLARTDWDAPKHRGLTMFLLKVHQPGVEIRRIKQVNGNNEFCEEFFDDVEVPVENVVGEINGGWAVASRQLFHERNAVGGGSPYESGNRGGLRRGAPAATLIDLARRTGRDRDRHVRELIAEAHAITKVQQHLIDRVVTGMRTENLPPTSGSIIRLFSGESASRRAEIGLDVAGLQGVFSAPGHTGDRENGEAFIFRQAGSLGGGSTEMARNIISERVLGMPREVAADRDVAFNQVRRGR
ncbi:MAG: acyl-CoA dehydrogenase [Pseudonocardiales bacterium]|nr:acyl-CoA dehydrogenase [Pseudonocardiales bacterium]